MSSSPEELTKELSLTNQDKAVEALKIRLKNFEKNAELTREHLSCPTLASGRGLSEVHGRINHAA